MRIGRLGYCRVIVACKSGCCLFGYRDGGTNGSGALGDHANQQTMLAPIKEEAGPAAAANAAAATLAPVPMPGVGTLPPHFCSSRWPQLGLQQQLVLHRLNEKEPCQQQCCCYSGLPTNHASDPRSTSFRNAATQR
ncbi:BZIP domain-containing protein [Pycnococcus provasolii]